MQSPSQYWRHKATESELQIQRHETNTICLCDGPHAIASTLSYYAARVVHVRWGTGHVAPNNGSPCLWQNLLVLKNLWFLNTLFIELQKKNYVGGNYVRNCKGGFDVSETAVPERYWRDCKTLWCVPVRIAENTALVRMQDTRGHHMTKGCVLYMLAYTARRHNAPNRQWTYNVTFRRVLATIAAVEKQ